jgi:hypothetical protein
MADNIMPLAVYPFSVWEEIAPLVKEAKSKIDTNIKLIPAAAVPGSPRVLSVGGPPPFVCEYAMVRKPSVDAFVHALSAYMGLTEDPRWATFETWFKEACGIEVKEIGLENIEASVGFR